MKLDPGKLPQGIHIAGTGGQVAFQEAGGIGHAPGSDQALNDRLPILPLGAGARIHPIRLKPIANRHDTIMADTAFIDGPLEACQALEDSPSCPPQGS